MKTVKFHFFHKKIILANSTACFLLLIIYVRYTVIYSIILVVLDFWNWKERRELSVWKQLGEACSPWTWYLWSTGEAPAWASPVHMAACVSLKYITLHFASGSVEKILRQARQTLGNSEGIGQEGQERGVWPRCSPRCSTSVGVCSLVWLCPVLSPGLPTQLPYNLKCR